MKVRLSDDEIRVRLIPDDVQRLLDGGTVDCVVMPGRYAVRMTTSAHVRSEVSFTHDGIDVTLPSTALPADPADFETHRWAGDARHPEVIVELDKQRRPRKRSGQRTRVPPQ